ncbi:MAG: hypothetical protein JWQ10_3983 [Herbaspirillum sp.]|nr:hypothetical protein [Herbaspirillum sp.]
MQGIGQTQAFHQTFHQIYSQHASTNASVPMPSHTAIPTSAIAPGNPMRYTRLSNAAPDHRLQRLRNKRESVHEKGPSPYDYLRQSPPKFDPGIPIKESPAGPPGKPLRRPQPAQQTPALLLGLQDFFDEQNIDVRVKIATTDALKHLHALLLPGTKSSITSFPAGELPLSQALVDLMRCFLKAYGFHDLISTLPNMDDAYRRRIVGNALIALILPNRSASEVDFSSFNFLNRIRANLSIAKITEEFALWTGFYLERPNEASTWAASMMLPLLHPELARSDTPAGVIYGSLEWADLRAAVDMLAAAGIDHGNFTHTELSSFARQSAAGAKLNNAAGKELWRIQTPVALWHAHANRQINLTTNAIDTGSAIETAIDYLDRRRTDALKAPLPILMSAIDTLKGQAKTREEIARIQLRRLGLKPDSVHEMVDQSELKWNCKGKQTIVTSYLKDCVEVVENAYCLKFKSSNACDGNHVPDLNGAVERELDKFGRLRAEAFSGVLNVALKNCDAQTLNDWQADDFTILRPMWQQIPADAGVIVKTTRKNVSRFYAVSTQLDNVLDAIDIANEDALAAYVLNKHSDYFNDTTTMSQTPHRSMQYASRMLSFKTSPKIAPTLSRHIKAVVEAMPQRASNTAAGSRNLYLGAAKRLKRTLAPFDSCIASIAGEPAQASEKFCQVDLSRADINAMQSLNSQSEKIRYLENLTRATMAPEVAREASERFKAQLSNHALAQRPSTLRSVLHSIARATAAAPENQNQPYRLPGNSVRLIADPAISNRFFGVLAKMLGRNPSTKRIQQQLEIAGNRPAPLSLPSVFPSRLLTANPGEMTLRIKIPSHTELRQIPDPVREAQGLVRFVLNGRSYQIDLYSVKPELRLLSDIERLAQDLPLCREERALPQTVPKAQACETTLRFDNGNGPPGRIIEHQNRFIQLAPLPGQVQRPRREATIFFPENQAPQTYANIVLIDQVLFRGYPGGVSAEWLQYRRVTPPDHLHNFPPVRPLPDELEARLQDRGPGERPMIEYVLDSEYVAVNDTATHTEHIQTRIRRDFFSRQSPTSTNATRGLVEVSEGHFYDFAIPDLASTWPIEVTLRRTTDQTAIAEFTRQPNAEVAVRSAPFTVNVRPGTASIILDIVWKCRATNNLLEALKRSMDNNGVGSGTVLTSALMTYIENHAGRSIATVSETALEQLNVALTGIMRSISATRDFRVLLRDNYQRYRSNVVFDTIPIPPRALPAPRTPETPPEVRAMETQLRGTLDLFGTIFPALNFQEVWALQGLSRAQIIRDEFTRIFDHRNVAIAIVELTNGRIIHYFSVSGSRAIPAHIENDTRYILARDMPPAGTPLPHFPNLSSAYVLQSREGDCERMLSYRLLRDYPQPNAIKKVTIISLLEICHSCTVCCIAYAERHRNAAMDFLSFPALPKPSQKGPRLPDDL